MMSPNRLDLQAFAGVDGRVAVRAAEEKQRRKSKVMRFGSIAIPYQEYRNAGGRYWMLFYYEGGRRRREARSSFEKLKKRAETIAPSIANGQIAMAAFSEADRAAYLRAIELLGPTKKPIELAIGEYTESVQILAGRASLAEACRFYIAQHPAGIIAKNAPKIVEEMLSKKVISDKWKRNLSHMLDRFAIRFAGPIGTIQAHELEDWLDSLPGGLRNRRNHRNAVQDLVGYAKGRGYLRKDWDGFKEGSNPEPPIPQVNLYTPEELVRMLNVAETYKAGRKLVPFIAITAFAGVRHGEMNEEKAEHLDWADIDFEGKGIYIGHGPAKTGRDRAVDMPDNLIAWIQTYRRPSGRICALANTSNALCRLRKRAGIAAKRNGLRKSFISYKLALTRNIEGVADQAGNSAAIIRKNYKRTDTRLRTAAERWFSIMPVRAEVLPLFAWARQR